MTHEEALRSDALECYTLLLEDKGAQDALSHAEIMMSYCIFGSYKMYMWDRVSQLLSDDLSLNFN